jgi:CheY-like chemotaxis protein
MNIQPQVKLMQQDTVMRYSQNVIMVSDDKNSRKLPPSSATHSRKNAFVVTGDEDLRGMLKYALNFYGLKVMSCQGGDEAPAFSTIGQSDCIILDCDTPGMEAIEHIRRLRKQFASTVIIGLGKEDKGIAYLEAGMNDFFQKPFSPYLLAMTLNGGDNLA